MSARARTHLTASKGSAGSAAIAARSSARASIAGRPSRHREAAFSRSHPAASSPFSSSRDPTDGTGTSRFLRMKPTAFSTEPFSLPEYGLQ